MNLRSFLSIFALAPVAGVMAARDAMAAPVVGDSISARVSAHEFFIGEHIGEPVLRFQPIKVRPSDIEFLESRRFAAREKIGASA